MVYASSKHDKKTELLNVFHLFSESMEENGKASLDTC